MSPETYESIRRNSEFSRVMEHIGRFGDYCRSKGSIFSIMINPMRPNWHELPKFIEFCNSRNYYLWFNTIYRPFHLALWTLSSEELRRIRQQLSSHRFSLPAGSDRALCEGNILKYFNLVNGQISTWIREQEDRERRGTDAASLRLARRRSKSELMDRLKAAIPEEKLGSAVHKLSFVENGVSNNVTSEDFYHYLAQAPLDWLIHDLEHKSSEEMIEQIYYRAEYY
jgi:hypothetical protein